MSLPAAIAGLYDDLKLAIEIANANNELSLANSLNDVYRKTLVLSLASQYEHRITATLLKFVEVASQGDPCIVALVKNKAVKRQYHTYFQWDEERGRSAGPFYSLLGADRGGKLKVLCKGELKAGESAFLELGELRNKLVHQDFANFDCPKTVEEIHALCELAETYVTAIEAALAAN